MFGFTQSPTTCCQKSSHSVYKSHFCGLSCRLRRDYGHSARFLVNRDSTFLSLLGSALTASPNNCEVTTCCNPLSKPSALLIDSSIQSYSAAVAVCGLTAKCDDDASDHSAPRALLAKGLLGMTQSWKDRALSTLNSSRFPTVNTLSLLAAQTENETAETSVTTAASATANAYQNIFQHLGKLVGSKSDPALAAVGFSLGQLIYLRDAADDIEKDLKKNHYNPLRYCQKAEFYTLAQDASQRFAQAISELPLLRHQQVIGDITARTSAYHSDLFQSPSPKPSDSRSKKKNQQSFWDSCCAPSCCDCSCDTCTSSVCHSSSESSGCCDSCDCCGCDSCGCDCC